MEQCNALTSTMLVTYHRGVLAVSYSVYMYMQAMGEQEGDDNRRH